MKPSSRPLVLAVVVVSLVFTAGAVSPVTVADAPGGTAPAPEPGANTSEAATDPCRGTVTKPANGTTVVSVQGAKGGSKKPARLVGIGPNGSIRWVHTSADNGVVWSYDVDPLPNGNLFVTSTVPGDTDVYEFDPKTGERVWEKQFDALDTHDADLYAGGRKIAVANMRNFDEDAGENHDRAFVYDRKKGERTWVWEFRDHYPRSVGGNYRDDWTHVNDIDRVGQDRFLLSPRNFDQVVLVDQSSNEIVWTLGEDDNYSVLKEQHNPDYLEGPGGEATVVVGDSGNDRVVEFARRDGAFERTWTLAGDMAWPRDADRLPNGNTLVTDSRNHRVFEVTPEGTIVWEVYVPWLPYEAERVRYGDGSTGPTMAEQGATGDVELTGSAGLHRNGTALNDCGEYVDTFPQTTATDTPTPDVTATAGGDGTPTETYYGRDSDGGLLAGMSGFGWVAVGVVLVAAVAGVIVWRRRQA